MSKTTYALNYAFGHIAEIEQAVQELQTKNTEDQSFYVYVDLTKNPARMAVTTRPIDDPWFVLVYASTTETFTVKGENGLAGRLTNQIIEEGRIQHALRERKPRTDFVDIAFKGEEPQDDVASNDTTVDENFVKDVMSRIQDQLPQIWANATAYPVDNFRLDIFQLLPDVYTVDINIDTTDYQLSCNFSLHFDVDGGWPCPFTRLTTPNGSSELFETPNADKALSFVASYVIPQIVRLNQPNALGIQVTHEDEE